MIDPARLARVLEQNGHTRHMLGGGMFCTESGLAFLVGRSKRVLREWREAGDGPVGILIGRSWIFDIEDVAAWLNSRRDPPHSATERRIVSSHSARAAVKSR